MTTEIIRTEKISKHYEDVWAVSDMSLTVRENLEIFRRLRFLPDKKAVNEIIDKLQLVAYAERKVKNLSMDNNQRPGLAMAIIHKPQVYSGPLQYGGMLIRSNKYSFNNNHYE